MSPNMGKGGRGRKRSCRGNSGFRETVAFKAKRTVFLIRFFPVNLGEQYFCFFNQKNGSFLAGAERGQLTGVLSGELAHEYCGGMLGAADLRPALAAGVLGGASAALIEGRAQGVQVKKNNTCGDLGCLCKEILT